MPVAARPGAGQSQEHRFQSASPNEFEQELEDLSHYLLPSRVFISRKLDLDPQTFHMGCEYLYCCVQNLTSFWEYLKTQNSNNVTDEF